MKYKLIDHTADLGIRVTGRDPATLFKTAALAMLDCLTVTKHVKDRNRIAVSVQGSDWPDLMVNWLREILYLWTGRELLMKSVDIDFISEQKVAASVSVDPFDPKVHVIKSEIKAVTYHQIHVAKGSKGWEAKIIFDV